MATLGDFRVLTFDCYGTLIDWETGIWDAFQPLLMDNAGASIGRQLALETFADLENALQARSPEMPYETLLRHVHAQFAERFDLGTSNKLDQDFGDAIAHWPAFPDTAEALRYLKTRYRLVILSNVSRAGFAASNRKLGVEFDAVYTAEDVGAYKPSPANFEYLLEHLAADFGLQKNDILHTAQSLFHDHVPAKRFGLATAWIDRQRLSESGQRGATAKVDENPATDFLFFTMGEMAKAVAEEA
jgi:2-haloalkanoic acid dehalogenase type II